MKNRYSWILTFLLFFSSLDLSHALTEQEKEEIRTIVKEEISHVNMRIDDVNTRMGDMNNSLNKRIDDMSKNLYKAMDDMNKNLYKAMDDMNKNLYKAMDDMRNSLNKRIDDTNNRVNELYSLIVRGFGITWTGMLGLIGFILWDRRSMIRPVQRDVREAWDRVRKLEEVLREYAKKDPELASILKNIGI